MNRHVGNRFRSHCAHVSRAQVVSGHGKNEFANCRSTYATSPWFSRARGLVGSMHIASNARSLASLAPRTRSGERFTTAPTLRKAFGIPVARRHIERAGTASHALTETPPRSSRRLRACVRLASGCPARHLGPLLRAARRGVQPSTRRNRPPWQLSTLARGPISVLHAVTASIERKNPSPAPQPCAMPRPNRYRSIPAWSGESSRLSRHAFHLCRRKRCVHSAAHVAMTCAEPYAGGWGMPRAAGPSPFRRAVTARAVLLSKSVLPATSTRASGDRARRPRLTLREAIAHPTRFARRLPCAQRPARIDIAAIPPHGHR